MSSDEERMIGQYRQFEIIEPAWRSETVQAWLRVFDSLHTQAKRRGLFGDQRGAEPRVRVATTKGDPNRRFVPKLPRNAYDDEWFNSRVNAEDVIQPGPPARYFHDGNTIE
jgi:poly(A) polymerase Pap1